MSKNSLRISVVMPAFNGVNFIERAIKSVVDQDYPNLELFIKDGGSKDGSLDVIKYYAKKYPKIIKWISAKDKGQTDALNYGIKQVNGDIIGWLNCDDVYKKRAFKEVTKFFENNTNIMWVFGKCDIIDAKDKKIRTWITLYKNFWLEHYSYQSLLILNFISQMSVFWRKDIDKKIGLFDQRQNYVMDYDNWLKLGKIYKPGFINKYLGSFRIIPTSKSSTGFIKQFKDELVVAKKYTNSNFIISMHAVHTKLVIEVYSFIRFFNHFKFTKQNA